MLNCLHIYTQLKLYVILDDTDVKLALYGNGGVRLCVK